MHSVFPRDGIPDVDTLCSELASPGESGLRVNVEWLLLCAVGAGFHNLRLYSL